MLAGKEQDLPLLSQLFQEGQGQVQPLIVEIGQRVVQHQGDGVVVRQHLPAHRKAHRQVELIRRALGQGQRPAGRQAAGLRRQRLKLTGRFL